MAKVSVTLLHIGSSNIWKAGYKKKKMELTLLFINRKTWRYIYKGVPIRTWTGFLKSQSKGIYFVQNIKDTYNFKKIVSNK